MSDPAVYTLHACKRRAEKTSLIERLISSARPRRPATTTSGTRARHRARALRCACACACRALGPCRSQGARALFVFFSLSPPFVLRGRGEEREREQTLARAHVWFGTPSREWMCRHCDVIFCFNGAARPKDLLLARTKITERGR